MRTHPFQRIAIATLAVMVLAMPIGAQASEDCSNNKGTARVDQNLVVGLIAWIVARTGWAAQDPPTICFVRNTELVEMYTGGKDLSNHLTIRGLYSYRGHIIYLSEEWNPNDLYDRGELLHELIHHLQSLNNVKALCVAAYEQSTYELQIEWLREQGVQDPYTFLDIDEFTIRLISQCPD